MIDEGDKMIFYKSELFVKQLQLLGKNDILVCLTGTTGVSSANFEEYFVKNICQLRLNRFIADPPSYGDDCWAVLSSQNLDN